MSKFLTIKETEEIINTMLKERDLTQIAIVWRDASEQWPGGEYRTPDIIIKDYKFLWWKWQHKKLKGSWITAPMLIDLVKKAESALERWDEDNSKNIEVTDEIRRRHG